MTRTDPLMERLRDAAEHVDVPELEPDARAARAVRTVRTRRAVGGGLAALVAASVVVAPVVLDRDPAPTGPAATPTERASTDTSPTDDDSGETARTEDLPHVDGVVTGVPDDWAVHELAGLSYAVPPGWSPARDPLRNGARLSSWTSGTTGPAAADAVGSGTPSDLTVSVAGGYATWVAPDAASLAEAEQSWGATVETVDVPGADHVVVTRYPFTVDGAPGLQVQVDVREAGGVGYTVMLSVPDSARGEEILRGVLGSLGFV
ncbi:hypothetical protein [Cellulosimicrobium marinum]|uniref:hypothetical protein n=1 Tax=Cellulosimicrobium marinum TaxID=1638992 RepID=UPI001E5576F7|nr:hypothetical protein [Cellulosimicrobium marinum]MCB7135532.1 hypothetical protein [Cellulosimicrobium marinum]